MARTHHNLIELRIAVAHIAILVVFALPNFLETQIRFKLSRVWNDMHLLSLTIESFMTEWAHNPPPEC